ncbi:Mor transcription activator family protein [Pseudomonas sp. CAN2814]|uniref:Mor transcription activator family protein n=1 Tax=Pseudomonas sp. CAN1 TaxID=3046726 RepID=UPI002647F7E7|nr:Mor transcription activator family protein [Pseudomonas sp. CAN1]MDN6860720.1 Mor transcription activator family protein [Pseudomonas sp. CAN1]
MSSTDIDLRQVQDMLPDNVRDMAGRIGLPSTLVVVEQLGGTLWRVAEGRARRGEARRAALAELVGSEIEEQLHAHYKGEEIYVARCHKALVRWRDLEITERFERGLRDGQTVRSLLNDLAREYSLSSRWIWEVVNRPSEPSPQQSTLFH